MARSWAANGYDIGTLVLKDTGAGTFSFDFSANPGYFAIISNNTNGLGVFANESMPPYTGVGDSVSFVPEPSTLALIASGLIGLLCYAWRKRR